MDNKFKRTEMLLGTEAMKNLKDATVAVVGLGGVGSYALEAIARSGAGRLILIDFDTVDVTNINRQLIADTTTVGRKKTDVAAERVHKINPDADIVKLDFKYTPDNRETLFQYDIDYVIDAIDIVTSKIDLIVTALERNIPIISAMGTGNKLHPEMLEITTLEKTSGCPLARVMRRELGKRGIKKLDVVYSKETPLVPLDLGEKTERRSLPGSTAFVPSVAGLMMASRVIQNLTKKVEL